MSGITAAFYGEVTLEDERIEQSNCPDYQILRVNQAPAVEVHVVKSRESPGGAKPGVRPSFRRQPTRSLPQLTNDCAGCQSIPPGCDGRCGAAGPKVNLKRPVSSLREKAKKVIISIKPFQGIRIEVDTTVSFDEVLRRPRRLMGDASVPEIVTLAKEATTEAEFIQSPRTPRRRERIHALP
jgi:hypothetical protein